MEPGHRAAGFDPPKVKAAHVGLVELEQAPPRARRARAFETRGVRSGGEFFPKAGHSVAHHAMTTLMRGSLAEERGAAAALFPLFAGHS